MLRLIFQTFRNVFCLPWFLFKDRQQIFHNVEWCFSVWDDGVWDLEAVSVTGSFSSSLSGCICVFFMNFLFCALSTWKVRMQMRREWCLFCVFFVSSGPFSWVQACLSILLWIALERFWFCLKYQKDVFKAELIWDLYLIYMFALFIWLCLWLINWLSIFLRSS